MLYPQYRVWRTHDLRDLDGILVATDVFQEWLLPWWWDHYSEHNTYPVAFVDLGMGEEMKEWCREHGELICLRIANVFVTEQEEIEVHCIKEWERIYGKHFWPSRCAWFKKPLACLQSPFRHTLWLDLDCEVRGPLDSLFSFSNHPSGIGLCKESWKKVGDPLYNSGVISFKHSIPIEA